MLLTLLAGNLNSAPSQTVQTAPARQQQPDDTIYQESRRDLTSPLLFWRNVLAETEVGAGLFRASYRLPEEEVRHTRSDHQLYFQFVQPAPQVAPVVAPPAGGGLLPGKLGTGMGPYKRPGQVFGEPDPISPRLSSRAALTPQSSYSKAPDAVPTLPGHYDEAVFALVAMEELTGDWLSGPITLHIVRRKV
jgi:hypothetical protein